MNSNSDRILNAALVIAALAIAAVLVHREFFSDDGVRGPSNTPTHLASWHDLVPNGRTVGNPDAPVKVIAFVDLQCPYCRRFHETVRSTMRKYPNQVVLVYIHLPLPGHRLAMPAARALECANKHDKFEVLVDYLFERQDSLKVRDTANVTPWTADAFQVGIVDTAGFTQCMKDPKVPQAIEKGLSLSKQFDVRGTPTVIVNGWRFARPPTERELSQQVDELLAQRRPRSFLSRLLGRS
jgi:protein-disulfide isomerase